MAVLPEKAVQFEVALLGHPLGIGIWFLLVFGLGLFSQSQYVLGLLFDVCPILLVLCKNKLEG